MATRKAGAPRLADHYPEEIEAADRDESTTGGPGDELPLPGDRRFSLEAKR